MHFALRALGGSGVDDILAVDKTHYAARDRAGPRDIGDGERDRRTDHRHDLRQVVRLHRHDSRSNCDVVPHILREERADRTVDQARSQDRLFARPALTAHKAAGNTPYRVEFFLKIHGQREEIDAVARLCRRGRGDEHARLAVAHHACAVGKTGKLAGLYDKFAPGKHCLVRFLLRELNLFDHFSASIRNGANRSYTF